MLIGVIWWSCSTFHSDDDVHQDKDDRDYNGQCSKLSIYKIIGKLLFLFRLLWLQKSS